MKRNILFAAAISAKMMKMMMITIVDFEFDSAVMNKYCVENMAVWFSKSELSMLMLAAL